MATHAEDKATAMATQAGDKAEQVGDSKALEVLARVGLVAYGVVHLLLGWLALQIARGDLRLPAPLPVVPGLALAASQAPQGHREEHPPPLLPLRIVAGQPQPGTAQPHHGRHQPLPLPGRSHPDTLAGHRIATIRQTHQGPTESPLR